MKFLLVTMLIFHDPQAGVVIETIGESFKSRPVCLKWLDTYIADKRRVEGMTFLRPMDQLFFCEPRSKDEWLAREVGM